jgi:hypothetical protein
VFLQQLAAIDDEELLEQGKLFSTEELRGITFLLKRYLFKLYWTEPVFDINTSFMHAAAGAPSALTSGGGGSGSVQADYSAMKLLKLHTLSAATKLFNHLCQRNERRSFLASSDYSWGNTVVGFDTSIEEGGVSDGYSSLLLKNAKVKSVLTFIPQVDFAAIYCQIRNSLVIPVLTNFLILFNIIMQLLMFH